MLVEIAEFEIAGLALSVLTAGASDVAATLMAGERALKVVALVDADRLAAGPDAVQEGTAVSSPKARPSAGAGTGTEGRMVGDTAPGRPHSVCGRARSVRG
ncbi:hypothetical protein ACIBL8_11800 [Streptomyces sp. NPDC050523]|uniref:hypothetical protein n=1 Tax=Streptomyces sp. NPDC050523 TaxID=3365622 RepID=UPI0037925684